MSKNDEQNKAFSDSPLYALLFFSPSGNIHSNRYLSGYYPTPEFGIPTSPCDGYERIPTLVAMADVYVNTFGYVWNERVSHSLLNEQ